MNAKHGSTIEVFRQRPTWTVTVRRSRLSTSEPAAAAAAVGDVTDAAHAVAHCINLTPRTKHPIIASLTDERRLHGRRRRR